MKAVVVHQYGGPEVLKFEEYPDPGPGEVLVKSGPGVEGFSAGDQVFAMADDTYAELCVVKAAYTLSPITPRLLDRKARIIQQGARAFSGELVAVFGMDGFKGRAHHSEDSGGCNF
jgi:NADPH:quinone reductase-like Zn-dependent oxidoreductase